MSVTLASLDSGEASGGFLPVVILHGLMGSADNWRSYIKEWSAHTRVVAFDLRNHGRSPHVTGMNYDAMADDVMAGLKTHGITRCCLIGHSMGGKVAMTLARRDPECVERLVVADVAPVAYQHGHDDIFKAMRAVESARPKSRSQADAVMKDVIESVATRQFLATNLTRAEGEFVWRVGLDEIEADYDSIIAAPGGSKTFEKPTLFLRGGASSYVDEEGIEAARSLFTDLTIETLEGVGHWVHAEAPKAFREHVVRFLT
ncbi:alpha/beta fold hydrolase [Larsenimonas salina]|uniref:alpha/beta fold hydrolase n=1 Tax=Larsenimonas salina TaxID=1295565 RepID=UPI00207418E7|nr:alpha/beta fold hydrolase [Larsenimonas salina]MCM5703381.1 alpha/beta fold hydrolase [Larsenimonas salina]